jgi:hypothetical protein
MWIYRPSLSAKLVPTFADRGCHVVSVMNSYDHIRGFLDQSRYFFFQVVPRLYSWGWVDSVPDPLLRKSGSTGNWARASGSLTTTPQRWSCYSTRKEIFLFSMYRRAVVPSQPSVKRVTGGGGALSIEVMWLLCEADHSLHLVPNLRVYQAVHLPPVVQCLNKHRDNCIILYKRETSSLILMSGLQVYLHDVYCKFC